MNRVKTKSRSELYEQAGHERYNMFLGFSIGSVSGSGTRSHDSVLRDPVPDLETQSLKVRYRIPNQPYEDCLGVREYILSYHTAVISGLFS